MCVRRFCVYLCICFLFWIHGKTLKVKDKQASINFVVNANPDKVCIRSPHVHHGIRRVLGWAKLNSQVAFSTAGVEQTEIVWVSGTRACSKRHASKVLPGLWKTVSDICWGGQLANLVLHRLVIFSSPRHSCPQSCKIYTLTFQMWRPFQNAWSPCATKGQAEHGTAKLGSEEVPAGSAGVEPGHGGGAAGRARPAEPARAADAICRLQRVPAGPAGQHTPTRTPHPPPAAESWPAAKPWERKQAKDQSTHVQSPPRPPLSALVEGRGKEA